METKQVQFKIDITGIKEGVNNIPCEFQITKQSHLINLKIVVQHKIWREFDFNQNDLLEMLIYIAPNEEIRGFLSHIK